MKSLASLAFSCLVRASISGLGWLFFLSYCRSQHYQVFLSEGGQFCLLLALWVAADAKLHFLRPWLLPAAVGLQGQQFVQSLLEFVHRWAR